MASIPGRNPLRVIHVGVGTRGKSHLRAALESGFDRPVALVDVVPDYLSAARDLTGLPESACFGELEDALAAVDSDAVVIASPVPFHYAQIMAALRAGRHVLTEKCFTVGLAEAVECVAEADRRGKKLMVVQNWRMNRATRTLRRIVAEQTYGPLGFFVMNYYKPRIRPYNMSPHMQLWQQSVHELDTVLGVVQRPLRRVWGISNNPAWCDWPSPSTVQTIAEFDGRVSGTYVSTSNARTDGFDFRISCQQADVIATDLLDRRPLRLLWGPQNRHEEELALDPVDIRGLEHHPVARQLAAGERPDRVEWSLFWDMQIYRNFSEYILDGVEPESSGQRNLETMRFLDAIQRATETGRPVEFDS